MEKGKRAQLRITGGTVSVFVGGIFVTLTLEAFMGDWPWYAHALGAVAFGGLGYYLLRSGMELRDAEPVTPARPGEDWITRDQACLIIREAPAFRWLGFRPGPRRTVQLLGAFEAEDPNVVRGDRYDQMGLRMWLDMSQKGLGNDPESW